MNKLKETSIKFPKTQIWNDSCSESELMYALDNLAVGATTNPVIVLNVLEKEFDNWKPVIQKLIEEFPNDSEDDIAWKLIGKMGANAAKHLLPTFERTKGKKGRISFQVNAKYFNDSERIISHALELNELIDNAQIKAPTSSEGIKAFEELTYLGVSINATVSFTVSQAVEVAEAVERGLNRRIKEGKKIDTMSPVCTIMAGRVDDYLKLVVDKQNLIVDPECLEYAGVAVTKKAYQIYQERNYRTKLLVAAYRNHYHWSEFIGGDIILTIPYKWQKRYNSSHVKVKSRIENPVRQEYLEQLLKIEEFVEAYSVNGQTRDMFQNYGAFKVTMNQFLSGYDDLIHIVRKIQNL